MKKHGEYSGTATMQGWDCGNNWYSPFCEAGERIIGGIGSGSGPRDPQLPPDPKPFNYTPVILGGAALLAVAVLVARK